MDHDQFKASMFTKLVLFLKENSIEEPYTRTREPNDTIDRRKSEAEVIEYDFTNLRSEKKLLKY